MGRALWCWVTCIHDWYCRVTKTKTSQHHPPNIHFVSVWDHFASRPVIAFSLILPTPQFSSVKFSCSVVSNSLHAISRTHILILVFHNEPLRHRLVPSELSPWDPGSLFLLLCSLSFHPHKEGSHCLRLAGFPSPPRSKPSEICLALNPMWMTHSNSIFTYSRSNILEWKYEFVPKIVTYVTILII